MATIEVDDIKKISIKPGEILVVRVPQNNAPASQHARHMREIRDMFMEHLPVGAKVFVCSDFEFGVIDNDETLFTGSLAS